MDDIDDEDEDEEEEEKPDMYYRAYRKGDKEKTAKDFEGWWWEIYGYVDGKKFVVARGEEGFDSWDEAIDDAEKTCAYLRAMEGLRAEMAEDQDQA